MAPMKLILIAAVMSAPIILPTFAQANEGNH
jgi:hypothetical protein